MAGPGLPRPSSGLTGGALLEERAAQITGAGRLHPGADPTMPTLIPSDSICRKSDVLSAEMDGAVVIMNPDHGVYFCLDAIGSDIWRRLVDPMTAADLVAGLVETYEGDAQAIETDTVALLDRMLDKGMLVRVTEPA